MLKKQLNKYHEFSFKMPSKNKDFTAQQKAAIMRVYNRVETLMRRERKEKATFIPVNYTKIKKSEVKKLEGIVTNKGIFFKYPGASLKYDRKDKQLIVKVEYDQNKELFIPFPESVRFDLELIIDFVEQKVKRFKPDYIMWSVNGYMGSEEYDPKQFFKYATQKSDEELDVEEGLKLSNHGYYTGVFFGWRPKSYKK